MAIRDVMWDMDDEPEGNVEHVAEHGLTKTEPALATSFTHDPASTMGQRITRDRPLTDDEKLNYREIRQQIAAELPDIKRRAKDAKPRILLKQLVHTLKQERTRQGISLADVNAKSGIDCGSLSQLENDEDPDVTMTTLLRYAEAIGKTLTVQIEDAGTASGY